MSKKNIWLVAVLVVLAAAYVCFFTDWFKPKTVRIYYTTRSIRHFGTRHSGPVVFFGLMGKFQLTEVKAIPLAGFQTNPETLPVWHLISDSNSIPVGQFIYGERIRGMKPSIAGERAQPLQTNVVYRLFVTAGKIKGWHDFEIK